MRAAASAPRQESARDPKPAHSTLGPEEWKHRLHEATMQLAGSDPAAIQQALSTLGELQGRDAAEAVMTRLRQGLPPQLAEQALEVLAALKQPITTPVLVELTLHRRWQIREKAVHALGTMRVRSTVSALIYALDDPSSEVRSAAAQGLAQLGDARALPALAMAAQRGVAGSLTALAELATAKQVPLFLSEAKRDLKETEPALRVLLSRPNLALASKMTVLTAVSALGTPDAQAVLESWRSALGKADSRVVAALDAQAKKRAQPQPDTAKPDETKAEAPQEQKP